MMGKIIGAWVEDAHGPGWSNAPLWYVVVGDGLPRIHCLQPEEQTMEMRTLAAFSELANRRMVAAVEDALSKSSPRGGSGGGR